jgi:tetratricopeptide (TPR) repeat protein
MSVADLKAKAREAFKRKNYDHAVDVYLEAIQFSPDDIELYEGLQQAAEKRKEGKGKSMFGGGLGGLAIEAVRDPGKRIIACARYLAKNPGDKGVAMKLGDAAVDAGHVDAAIYAYRTAAKADPDDNVAWKKLGHLLYRRGRIQESLDAFGEAVRLDPKDQEALKMRKNLAAEGALKTSGFETAKSSRELLRDKEMASQLERERRIQLSAQDAQDEAGRLRAELAKAPPGPATNRTRIRLADILLQKGEAEAGLSMLEEALREEPGNYDLSVRIGDIKLARIQEDFQRAKARLEGTPEDAGARSALEAARGDLIEARLSEYGRRVREHPTDLAEHYKYGATLLMAGRVDDAIGEFQQTVRDPKRKTDSLMLLGECFEKKNMLDLAAKKLAEAAADFPLLTSERAKDVAYRLASLHERRGAVAEARKEFERIYEVDISYRDVAKRVQSLTSP